MQNNKCMYVRCVLSTPQKSSTQKWRPKNIQLRKIHPRTNLNDAAVSTFRRFLRAHNNKSILFLQSHTSNGPRHEPHKVTPRTYLLLLQARGTTGQARFHQACRHARVPTRHEPRKGICL